MSLCTLVESVAITGTLGDGGMSTCVLGGGGVSVTDTLRNGRTFTCTSVRVNRWGFFVGTFLLEAGAWGLIKLLVSVVLLLRSHIDVYPFPLEIPLADYLRFHVALTTRLVCVTVGFVIFLCWKTTVSVA